MISRLSELGNIRLTPEELEYLKKTCPYLNDAYLRFLSNFRFKPAEQIDITFTPVDDTGKIGRAHV